MERRDVSTRNEQDPKRENFLSDKKALIYGPILPEFQDSVKSSKMDSSCAFSAKISCILLQFIDDSLRTAVSDMPFIRIGLHSFSGLRPAMNKLRRSQVLDIPGKAPAFLRGRL